MFQERKTFIGIHMMLPRHLIEDLDRRKTRCESRTSVVAKAIEDYLTKMRIQDGVTVDQELDWSMFKSESRMSYQYKIFQV